MQKKPLFLFGQGTLFLESRGRIKAFIEKHGIPSASTVMGLSALPTDHKLHVGCWVCMATMRQMS